MESVRFSLQEVKKQVQRRGGELYVSLHFLQPGELRDNIERLIDYHESLLGRPQKQFSVDDSRALIGDYRLANCLSAALSAWYSWQARDWTTVLQQAASTGTALASLGGEKRRAEVEERAEASSAPTNTAIASLEEAGITSPVGLRLALYNYVNERYQGFLSAEGRVSALREFGEVHGLSVPDLEYLLALDSEDEALLVRVTPERPTAQEVATLYNQWAFEAALFNASNVHFTIDCGAFIDAQQGANETGLGAIIKRFCFLARKLGVYYDLAYEPTLSSLAPLLHLTLYGPQDVTGLPQQYGLRLARLCRLLLGYSLAPRSNDAQGNGRRAGRRHTALVSALVEAEATVHVSQRTYRFVLDAKLLSLLPLLPAPPETVSTGEEGQVERQGTNGREPVNLFDSSIEQLFAEAFASLERSQGVDGWRLEREPEPLLLEAGAAAGSLPGIFIPDFALTRDSRRIYMEILGFWTPAYRERKIQKLQQLQGRDDILLAIPAEARDAFAAIASSFPIAWYEGQLSATELLNVLRGAYDDFAERLARVDPGQVREQVRSMGLVPERACYALLHCYRRSEVQRASERVVGEGIAFVSGIGLFSHDWMEHLWHSFVEWIGEAGRLSLADVLRESRERWPQLAGCEDATIEAILGLWPEAVRVNRTSIFAATVEAITASGDGPGAPEPASDDGGSQLIASKSASDDVGARLIAPAPPKKQVRERRPAYKKRATNETIQGDLWG